MPDITRTLVDFETRFWQSLVDQDIDTALDMLGEPALLVSAYGAAKFDHDTYRRMAEQGPMTVTAFDLSDMEVVFPNDATAVLTYRVRQEIAPRGQGERVQQEMADSSTWVRNGSRWQCVLHTETPVEGGH
jgi:hypothetical protein